MTTDETQSEDGRLVYEIVEAGAMAGLGRNGSYAAANSGFMPTVQISPHRRVVPKKKWDAILNGDAA